jgi:hypothetical protein
MESITKLEIKIEPIKLEYKQITSGIKNILLIDDTVYQNEILFDSVNSDTLAIKYNYNSDKNELEKILTDNFEFINRIGFVFDDSLMNSKQFLNSELFFTPDDLTETQTEYSNNLKFIIEIIKKFNITNLDYLVCGGLKHDNWVKYFTILNKETEVIVGASNDETGNIKYGGDWILESTNEDIANIYWDSKISNYTSTLVTSIISSSTTISDADIAGYSWPITINGGTSISPIVITLGDDITLNSISEYFIIGSEYITLDGGNKTILINGVVNYPGLVLNGTNSSNGYSNITIQNINVSTSNGSTIQQEKGWICWNFFGKASSNNQVTNCSSSGAISGDYSGGIFGSFSSGSATNCYSSGAISGNNTGGIFGDSSTGSATNCYSSGSISGIESGGIFGSNSTGNATNCYSSGSISGIESGGIFGSYSYGDAVNCYSSGSISGLDSGGIFGFDSFSATITCYAADNAWSDSTASLNLTGAPIYALEDGLDVLVNPVGTIWIDIAPSNSTTPWLFSTFGLTPYSSTSNTTFTQTILQNQSTNAALVPTGHTYSIVSINDTLPSIYPSITIDSSGLTGGKINTTSETPVGTYNIKVMQNSDYSITNFELTLNAHCYLETTKILCIVDGKEIYKEIRDIKIGDTVKTYLYGGKKVINKGKVLLQNNMNPTIHKLYVMSKESNNELIEDLYISGQHSILVDKLTEEEKSKSLTMWSKLQKIDDKELLMTWINKNFEEVMDNKIYTLYQLVLESDDEKQRYGIYANGILTETMSLNTFKRKKNMEKI